MTGHVYIVDDDESVRLSLQALLSTCEELTLSSFASGNDFFDTRAAAPPGVLLLDNHMPGRSGIEILELLKAEDSPHEVIVLTGQGDIELAVEAMKKGAHDFLEKPYRHEQLLAAIAHALDRLQASGCDRAIRADAKARIDRLSSREREVLEFIANGHSNKIAAAELGLSIRTIEVYRAHLLDKLGVRTLPEAVRMVFAAKR